MAEKQLEMDKKLCETHPKCPGMMYNAPKTMQDTRKQVRNAKNLKGMMQNTQENVTKTLK